MERHWVNVNDRKPEEGAEVQVVVIQRSTANRKDGDAYNIDYSLAKVANGHWVFLERPQYPRLVAWLEAERRLNRSELEAVPKDSIRF